MISYDPVSKPSHRLLTLGKETANEIYFPTPSSHHPPSLSLFLSPNKNKCYSSHHNHINTSQEASSSKLNLSPSLSLSLDHILQGIYGDEESVVEGGGGVGGEWNGKM